MARARSVHAILRAQSVHGKYSVIRCPNIYVFGISTTNVVIWHYFGNDFEKNIFFTPFGFRVICPLVFGLRAGFIFELESSGFHQTSSLCDLHPHPKF